MNASLLEPELRGRAAPAGWSLAGRVLFRFLFCYYILYAAPALRRLIPDGGLTFRIYLKALNAFAIWAAVHVFHITGTDLFKPDYGDGDTQLKYLLLFCSVSICAVACAIWSIVDRRRLAYTQLSAVLTLLVRYLLATTILTYGFLKVIPTLAVPNARLIEPLGDFSLMDIFWTSIGSSPGYEIFTGCVECLGGALLLFRRTAVPGAMVTLAAMVNVVLLNMTYDIAAKILSCNLLVMSVLLLAPFFRRLADLLLFNRPVQPLVTEPLTLPWPYLRWQRYLRWGGLGLKVLIFGALAIHLHRTRQNFLKPLIGVSPELDGIYEVERLVDRGIERPPLATDSGRWWKVGIDRKDGFGLVVAIRSMDDTFVCYGAKLDTSEKTLTLLEGNPPCADNPPGVPYVFGFSRPDKTHVELKDRNVDMVLRKVEPPYQILKGDFHWIRRL
jgi:hypothetical protein